MTEEKLCEACAHAEVLQAAERWGREESAKAKGEKYDCDCPVPSCTHGESVDSVRAEGGDRG